MYEAGKFPAFCLSCLYPGKNYLFSTLVQYVL